MFVIIRNYASRDRKKNVNFSRAEGHNMKILTIFLCFKLDLGVHAPRARAKKIRAFYKGTT